MTDEETLKRARINFYIGIVVLPLAILILIISLSIQFSDQSDKFIVLQVDWSVYLYTIIAMGYGIISIVWYIYVKYFEGQANKKRMMIDKKFTNDEEKGPIIEQARQLYSLGDEYYKTNRHLEALKQYEEAYAILKKNNIKNITLEKDIRENIRWIKKNENLET